jgi:hypothetical protein
VKSKVGYDLRNALIVNKIMAMGRRRKRIRQEGLWTPTAALPVSVSHPFYQRLNEILDEKKFDEYVETIRGRNVRKPHLFKFRSVNGRRSKLAIMTERHEESF